MPERTSENGGVDWIHEKVSNNDPTGLTEDEAREQLLWDLRDQLGTIHFTTERFEESRHDGVVIAKIGGEQIDHYGFEDN
jgi:hypothetical protein